jgi:tetratricopeptide (TPR) repeat protein
MMASERASTQAIRDSMRFVNQASRDSGTHWSQPIVEALDKSVPARSARDDRAVAARYQALQHQQKVQMLEGLASSGYLPAIVELGEAYLSGDIGLAAQPAKALDYLRRAASLGDATSAYNAGVAAQRAGLDGDARPLFEQAARAGVRGAAYRVALEAINTADWSGAITFGKRAAADKSAIGAYIVCVAAQAASPAATPYANPLTSEYCPMAYDLGYPDSAEDAGNGLAHHGDWARAQTYYLRCSERTGSRYCLRGAGMSAFKAQKWPEADQLLTKAIAAGDDDEHAELILALIAIHGEPKQWDKAERMLKAVLAHRGPKSAEAHFHLAAVYSLWPDREFPGELIDGHLYASARGGYGEAQQMLREAGKRW